MEHACQQCGTTVEDGRPFCPQCHAPQIHVQIAIREAGDAAVLNSAPDTFSPEIPAEPSLRSSQPRPIVSASTMDRGVAVRAALMAGVLGVFIQMIPLLGSVLTGTLAVFLYRRESRIVPPAALGSRLGGAAGVVASAINALWITVQIFVFHATQEYIDILARFAPTLGANAADPNFQAYIHSLFTPVGLAITFVFGMIFAALFASVGGALASLFLRPRDPRA